MLRIFADESITFVREWFGPFGRVTTAPGSAIRPESLREADVLLVRSVTKIDADLLKGTPVKFVGSATAGTDHVDLDSLDSLGIRFAHAPGSNAPSVCDYVIAAICTLAARDARPLKNLQCGVIGCGAIGSRLARRLEKLGLTVLRCDPPLDDALKRRHLPSPFIETDAAITASDILTLHVPLHSVAPYSTLGLLSAERMNGMKDDAWIVNTSRGAVVDEPALIEWLDRHPYGRAVVDVWAREPTLSCELLRRTSIGTAHIAGYAVEGKRRATRMLRDALAAWLGQKERASEAPPKLIELQPQLQNGGSDEEWLHHLVRTAYDVEADHEALLAICDLRETDRATYFESLRRTYPIRHELSRYCLPAALIRPGLETAVAKGLGMTTR